MTVGQLRRSLENADDDREVHFTGDVGELEVWEMWTSQEVVNVTLTQKETK